MIQFDYFSKGLVNQPPNCRRVSSQNRFRLRKLPIGDGGFRKHQDARLIQEVAEMLNVGDDLVNGEWTPLFLVVDF